MNVEPRQHAAGHTTETELATRIRREHGNLLQLVLALESQLESARGGGALDADLTISIVRFVDDYARSFHPFHDGSLLGSIEERAARERLLAELTLRRALVRAQAVQLCRRLRAPAGGRPRDGIAELGFPLAAALRRLVSFEESELVPLVEHALVVPASTERDAEADERRREAFDALTRAVGCGCTHE